MGRSNREEFIRLVFGSSISLNQLKELVEFYEYNSDRVIKVLRDITKDTSKGEAVLEQVLDSKQQFVTLLDKDYPLLLRSIYDPPSVIFYEGDINLASRQSISIVGSRKVAEKFTNATAEITGKLARTGIVLVSGLAYGVDAVVHQATLKSEGFGIAVLPGPLENPVPAGNQSLAKSIAKRGLLISEMLPGSKIFKGSFPRRNRLIAGLSQATLVTAAREKSGALITARHAVSYGREVFALPGGLDEQLTKGNNFLLKSLTAKLVEGASEILEEIGFKYEKESVSQENQIDDPILVNLTQQPKTAEELSAQFDKTIGDTLSLLTILQLKGKVYQDELLKFNLKK